MALNKFYIVLNDIKIDILIDIKIDILIDIKIFY
jgi:hypothetical protein